MVDWLNGQFVNIKWPRIPGVKGSNVAFLIFKYFTRPLNPFVIHQLIIQEHFAFAQGRERDERSEAGIYYNRHSGGGRNPVLLKNFLDSGSLAQTVIKERSF
jgi:hypothetical protein